MFAVPCGAADDIARAARITAVFRVFDGPVVRQGDLPPVHVGVAFFEGVFDVAKVEIPVFIQ